MSTIATLREVMRRRLDRIDAAVMMGCEGSPPRHIRCPVWPPHERSAASPPVDRQECARRDVGSWTGPRHPRRIQRKKGKECDRHVCFDERICTGIAQEPDNRSILPKGYEPGWAGISDAGCEPGEASRQTCLVARASPSCPSCIVTSYCTPAGRLVGRVRRFEPRRLRPLV
jgi:hypothetical protein